MNIDRDRLRKLAEDATPGPWVATYDAADQWHSITGTGHSLGGGLWMTCPEVATVERDGEEDAAFIAASRTAVPELLDALDVAEADHREAEHELYVAETGRLKAEARIQAVWGVLEFHGPEHAPENEADVHEDCGFRIVADLHRALDGDA